MVGINEWLEVTYITSLEYCGKEIDTTQNFNFLNHSDHKSVSWYYGIHRPRIVCSDGFSMSVQGGYGSYSEPRRYTDCYDKMEIGFPTHFDDPEFEDNNSGICGYVPIEDIQKVVERHGGIDMIKSLNGYNYNNTNKYLYNMRKNKFIRILKDNI